MSRVERKKVEKQKYQNKIGKLILLVLAFSLLFGGIKVVDDVLRSRMLIEEKVFEYTKMDQQIHKINFCGAQIQIDEKDIQKSYIYLKNQVKNYLEILEKNIVSLKSILKK